MTEEPQSEPDSDKPAKKGLEKIGKPVMEKPVKPGLERPSKTATKPGPTDSFIKQGSEKANKSPPPPPPRKTYPSSSSGMTTTRSGEVVYTSRKEFVSAQVSLVGVCLVKCCQTAATAACDLVFEILKRKAEENTTVTIFGIMHFLSCHLRVFFFFRTVQT